MKKEILITAFQKLHKNLFSRARSIVMDDDDANDILQDAFVRLWSSNIELNREEYASSLLNKTVHNLSIDLYRKNHSHCNVPISPEIDEHDETTDNDTEQLYNAVTTLISKNLSQRDREILIHRDRDEWSFEELAEEYNLSTDNIRKIISRARRTVRNIYNQSSL